MKEEKYMVFCGKSFLQKTKKIKQTCEKQVLFGKCYGSGANDSLKTLPSKDWNLWLMTQVFSFSRKTRQKIRILTR
jgi:hypothetical protein